MDEVEDSRHDKIKHKIADACRTAGFLVKEEYQGIDWRADVLALDDSQKIAFEVQITKQSLNRTLERQAKYIRDSITGCWLFEKEPAKLKNERIDLPLFRFEEVESDIFISLKERKTLSIETFVEDFLKGKIRFCKSMTTTPKQKLELNFIRMDCWKCGTVNHIYFANSGYYSACNCRLSANEMLWTSDKKEYRPEVVEYVQAYARTDRGKGLKLATIAERFSKTVGGTYTSFGCVECNSIFGDWFVHEAMIDSLYGNGIVAREVCEVEMDIDRRMDFPHWCHPGDGCFCE